MAVKRQREARGQGLVQYALIILLAALVTIAATFALGLAVQRVYGVVTGALGSKQSTTSAFAPMDAECWADARTGYNVTALVYWGVTSAGYDLSTLTGSTNLAVGTGMDAHGVIGPVPVTPYSGPESVPTGYGTFEYNPYFSITKADASLCPISAVVQSSDGQVAVAPVHICYVNDTPGSNTCPAS